MNEFKKLNSFVFFHKCAKNVLKIWDLFYLLCPNSIILKGFLEKINTKWKGEGTIYIHA